MLTTCSDEMLGVDCWATSDWSNADDMHVCDGLMMRRYRIAGLPILGVTFPLVLCGLCLPDALLNTPPEPVCCADFAFAALAMSSEIIPLLRVCQPGRSDGSQVWTHYVCESWVWASLSCNSHASKAEACAEVSTRSACIALSDSIGKSESWAVWPQHGVSDQSCGP